MIINDGRDVTVNFEPSEYMRKMIFQSVMQETRMKRSDFLQPELNLWTSSWLLVQMHALAQKSFQLTQKLLFMSKIFYGSSVTIFEFSQKHTCPLGKLRTVFTSLIAKSTSPGLMNTTFFAHCSQYVCTTSAIQNNTTKTKRKLWIKMMFPISNFHLNFNIIGQNAWNTQ